jgi:hypothetical protein
MLTNDSAKDERKPPLARCETRVLLATKAIGIVANKLTKSLLSILKK